MTKVNKSIEEDVPDAHEIELNIPRFVKTAVKDLAAEIQEEIEKYSTTSLDQKISLLSISEENENEIVENEENVENEEKKEIGYSTISTSPLPPDFVEESDPIEFAKSFMKEKKKKEEKKIEKKVEKKIEKKVEKKEEKENELKKMTVKELKDIAKEKNVKNYSKMKKDELIDSLKFE
jgi:hypothetical protein